MRIVNRGAYYMTFRAWAKPYERNISYFVSKFSRKSDTKKSEVFFLIVPRDESKPRLHGT